MSGYACPPAVCRWGQQFRLETRAIFVTVRYCPLAVKKKFAETLNALRDGFEFERRRLDLPAMAASAGDWIGISTVAELGEIFVIDVARH